MSGFTSSTHTLVSGGSSCYKKLLIPSPPGPALTQQLISASCQTARTGSEGRTGSIPPKKETMNAEQIVSELQLTDPNRTRRLPEKQETPLNNLILSVLIKLFASARYVNSSFILFKSCSPSVKINQRNCGNLLKKLKLCC